MSKVTEFFNVKNKSCRFLSCGLHGLSRLSFSLIILIDRIHCDCLVALHPISQKQRSPFCTFLFLRISSGLRGVGTEGRGPLTMSVGSH